MLRKNKKKIPRNINPLYYTLIPIIIKLIESNIDYE